MKNNYITITCILTLFLFACSEDNVTQEEEFQSFTSQVCPIIEGASALYWDFAHSLPIPLTEVPLLVNPGQQFIHSQQPLIGFIIPQGFTAFEINDNQTGDIGVNVIRNDNTVVFRWLPSSRIFGQVTANDILANE